MFTVEYSHRDGIDVNTIGDDDLLVKGDWGPRVAKNAVPVMELPIVNGNTVTVRYTMPLPDNLIWEPTDFGDYLITTVDGAVRTIPDANGDSVGIKARLIGSLQVRVDSPSVTYVDKFNDATGEASLRDAIIAANAAGGAHTIILDSGTYTIDIPHVADNNVSFPDPADNLYCDAPNHATGWSNETTGDFDITGNITIIGNQNDLTVIDAQGLDRVFKVHPGGDLILQRLTVTGGISPADQGGGGILSAGNVDLLETIVRDNRAFALQGSDPIRGGGIASWQGSLSVSQSWISENESDYGGGLFYCNAASGSVVRSTIDNNKGGGLHSHSDFDLTVNNSTFSANAGGNGALFNGKQDGNGPMSTSTLTATQVTVAFTTNASSAVAGKIHLVDVLLAENDVFSDNDASTTVQNVIGSLELGADLIGPLTRSHDAPPVHPLLVGNPAVDAGSATFVGTTDQRGATRLTPDIGAYEALSGSVGGTVFIDLDEDQVRARLSKPTRRARRKWASPPATRMCSARRKSG